MIYKFRIIKIGHRYYPQYKKWFGLVWKRMTQNNEFVYRYVERSDAEARIAKFKSDKGYKCEF